MCQYLKVAELLVVIWWIGRRTKSWAIRVSVKPLTDTYGTGSTHGAIGATVLVWCGLKKCFGLHQVAEQRPQYKLFELVNVFLG